MFELGDMVFLTLLNATGDAIHMRITATTEEAEKMGAVIGEQVGRRMHWRKACATLNDVLPGLVPGIHEAIEKKTWMAVTGHGHDVGGDGVVVAMRLQVDQNSKGGATCPLTHRNRVFRLRHF